jgi:hypothetical protein
MIKIHMFAGTFGRPRRFCIRPGTVSDIAVAPGLLEGLRATAVIAPSTTARWVSQKMLASTSMQIRSSGASFDSSIFRRFATRYDPRTLRFTGLRAPYRRNDLATVNGDPA